MMAWKTTAHTANPESADQIILSIDMMNGMVIDMKQEDEEMEKTWGIRR